MISEDNYNSFVKYYSGEFLNNLKLPVYHQFRHYRGKTAKGVWKKVPFRIGNAIKLQNWILKLGIIDLYYGTSCWLNPHRVASKGRGGSYKVADNLLLRNDLTFDIDAPEPITIQGLEKARKLALKIHSVVSKDKEKAFSYAAFSGFKGFRVVYEDRTDMIPNKTSSRIDYIEEKRKIFIHALKSKLSKEEISMLDEQITVNPMCVVRVIGSVNSKTGFLSVELAMKDLNKPINELLRDNVPVINREGRPGKNADGILMTTEDDSKMGSLPCPRPERGGKDASGLASPSNIHYFFTNKVIGTKCFVPVFRYPLSCPISNKELRRMQRSEKLGTLYIFTAGEDRFVFSLKTMQRRAVEKLLGKYHSSNAPQFKKRKRLLVPVHLNFERKLIGDSIKGTSRGHAMTLVNALGDSGLEFLEIVKAVVPGGL
jgi:hypothetical protein